MRTQLLRMSAIAAVATFATVSNASAQADAAKFLSSGVEDGNKLIGAYMSPLMKGFGVGLTDGWYNTAKALGTGGFDIRFNFGGSMVPVEDQTYKLDGINLNTDHSKPYVTLPPGTTNAQPTLYGAKSETPQEIEINVPLQYTVAGVTHDTTSVMKMALPTGTGVGFTPSLPMAQLSVGIYKKTELTLRLFPQMSFGDFKVGMFGLGVKHDIKQWIKPIADQKLWDWSIIGGFTTFNVEYNFSDPLLKPDPTAYNTYGPDDFKNQKMTFGGYGFMFGTMVSSQLGLGALNFTPYLGVNYAYSKVQYKMEGDYPIAVPNADYKPAPFDTQPENKSQTKIAKFSDPITIDGTVSNIRMNLGGRIKLGFITFSGEYSLGTAYSSFTGCVALNIQSIVPFKM